MTSGGGIAHAEETPRKNSGLLNGVQLWIALPDAYRNGQASFQHIDEVPIIEQAGSTVSVFARSLLVGRLRQNISHRFSGRTLHCTHLQAWSFRWTRRLSMQHC